MKEVRSMGLRGNLHCGHGNRQGERQVRKQLMTLTAEGSAGWVRF
jgi:hypothetical protein